MLRQGHTWNRQLGRWEKDEDSAAGAAAVGSPKQGTGQGAAADTPQEQKKASKPRLPPDLFAAGACPEASQPFRIPPRSLSQYRVCVDTPTTGGEVKKVDDEEDPWQKKYDPRHKQQ